MRRTDPVMTLLACLASATLVPAASRPLEAQAALDSASLPRFERVLLLDSTADTSANVSIGDLDGDGTLDLLLVKGRHWRLKSRVLLGDGRGGVRAAYNLVETGYKSYSGRLADLDRDGDLDVVLSNDAPDPKLTFLNDGKGRFSVGSAYGRPAWVTRNASVADLDGDSLPDIIVANRGENVAQYVCLNQGKGRFDERCAMLAEGSATTITPGDFDRDGMTDLAVPHRDVGQSHVYLNAGKGSFATARRVPFGPKDAAIRVSEVADLDADGILDIVAIDERRGVAIYHGRKDGTFSPGLSVSDGKLKPYALALGDVNGDGTLDIIVGHIEAPSIVYFGDGTGRRYTKVQFGDAKGTAYGFAIADLDGDRRADIAVAKSDAPSAIFFADPPRPR